jgi:hypothetical protein
MSEGSKVVKYAAKKLKNEEAGEQLIRAFKATRASDIYDGNLEMYLMVIAQTLEDRTFQLEELRKEVNKLCKASKEIYMKRPPS